MARTVVADFHDPHVGLGRIYTRTGDAGTTGLVGGQRVPKDHPRIEAYGTVDELNACIGLCAVEARRSGLTEFAARLVRVQHCLFNLGSCMSTLPADLHPRQPRVTEADVKGLEEEMDRLTASLPALRSFILPGGSELDARLHLARTVCRRAERNALAVERADGGVALELRYLNRLSDALFVWSRWAVRQTGGAEVVWEPNKA